MSMTASSVLSTHLDLVEHYRRPDPELVEANVLFGVPDGLVLRMLGTARTYQVSESMMYLAEHLHNRQEASPVLGSLDVAEFPWPNGFMCLDEPLKVDIDQFEIKAFGSGFYTREDGDELTPENVVAVSWLKTVAYTTTSGVSVPRESAPDLEQLRYAPSKVREAFEPEGGNRDWRTACWVIFWIEPPDEQHRQLFGPLFPCGWVVFPGYRARTRHVDQIVVSLVRALWALMDMELSSVTKHEPGRQLRKRAARLQVVPDVRVITLRRVHQPSEPTGEHKQIDWSCQWLVRPHRRHYSNGTSTWVRAYIKGPDNKPLRLNDVADNVLYRLVR